MTTRTGIQVRLAERPDRGVGPQAFRLEEVDVPHPAPGQILVANRFLSLDAGMAMRMSGATAGLPSYEVGDLLTGDAVGEVIASDAPQLPAGSWVMHPLGWRTHAHLDPAAAFPIDPSAYPSPSVYLSMGLVAYVAVTDIGEVAAGETVYVSSAAGSVGGLAGQFARELGAGLVVGSAGGPEKVAHLVEHLGYDAAFDRRSGSIADQLRKAAPDGIDVFVDNVGGAQLTEVLPLMRPQGRIVLTGRIDPTPAHLDPAVVLGRRLSVRGFTIGEHFHRSAEFGPRFREWLAEGRVTYVETVLDGIEAAPQGLVDLLDGTHLGKVVVRV